MPPQLAKLGSGPASLDEYTLFTMVLAIPFLYDFWRYTTQISDKFATELDSDLYETWLTPLTGGRKMDLKDPQWKDFRAALPLLSVVFVGMILLRRNVRDEHHYLGAGLGLAWVLILHRMDGLFLLLLFACNYGLMVVHSTRMRQGMIWAFNLAILFAVKRFGNFLHPSWMVGVGMDGPFSANASLFPWFITFNLMFLRLISLAEDTIHDQTKFIDLPLAVFYLCYPPLYLAGPIIRFHDFRVQVLRQQPTVSGKALLAYLGRFLFLLLSFEVFSTYVYGTAIARNLKSRNIAVEITSLEDIKTTAHWSFATLFGAWFKFAIIWRFSRLMALLDGINPPENMKGCIASTVNFRVFWKEWHSSFNAWLVRYMYVPLGGSKRGLITQAFASVACFLFVAAWHDFELRMLVWGLGISVALIPEICGQYVSDTWPLALRAQRDYPYLWDAFAALFGGLSIMALLFVNMFGFSLHETTWVLIGKMTETKGALLFALYWYGWMSLGAFVKLGRRRREANAANAASPKRI
ncbi:hypothetical protein BASA82_000512 [Batrachochytrium salamandrivorans]|nr:hypothetical protein BASA82_000512 [Batrachochytrium salamandrivorans]